MQQPNHSTRRHLVPAVLGSTQILAAHASNANTQLAQARAFETKFGGDQ